MGKATTARSVHAASRPGQRFVWVNCRLSKPALTVGLFGCQKNPSRGQPLDCPGKLLLARQGTLFLDGAEKIPPSIQAQLGEALENGELGIRLIVALEKTGRRSAPQTDWSIPAGTISLEIPPLRRRTEEIPYFCKLFFRDLCQRYGFPSDGLPEEFIQRFQTCKWTPGNLDALKNAIRLHFEARLTVSTAKPV